MSLSRIPMSILSCVALFAVPAIAHAAPPLPDARPGHVVGYVVDRNGDPAAGVRIQIAESRSNEVVVQLQTDRAGIFEADLAQGWYEVRGGLNVFPSARRTFSIASGQSMRLRMRLDEPVTPPSGTLYVKFTDVNGNAIPQIQGHVYSSETGDPMYRFIGDEFGSAKLELKPGIYYVETYASHFATTWITIEIRAGNVTETALVMHEVETQRTGVFVGYVSTIEGYPAPNVTGFIFSNATGQPVARFLTEQSGTVRFELPPGKYHLKTIKREYPSAWIEFEVIANQTIEARIVLM